MKTFIQTYMNLYHVVKLDMLPSSCEPQIVMLQYTIALFRSHFEYLN